MHVDLRDAAGTLSSRIPRRVGGDQTPQDGALGLGDLLRGLDVPDTKRLKALETENARLKRIVAERDLEIEVMKEISAKKW